MKNINWKYLLYFGIIVFVTFWMFIPIDMLITRKTKFVIDANYIITNLQTLPIVTIITMFMVIKLRKRRIKWSFRLFLEIITEIIISAILLGFISILTMNKNIDIAKVKEIMTLYIFYTSVESSFVLIIFELICEYEKRKKLEEERNLYKYNVLRKQIDPHFLFNSLNNIIALNHKGKTQEVSEYLNKLSNIYSYILKNNNKNDLVLVVDELNFIYEYIDMLKLRFPDKLKININLTQEAYQRKILFLTLQLLVENVVKHNSRINTTLEIDITNNNKEIIVTNNIVNRNENNINNEGIGLNNLKERYKIITNKPIIVNSNDKEFSVKVPLI